MAKGIIDYNGNKIEFEPPTPTVDKRGGIYAEAAEDTTDMTEVVVGADGKGYVDIVTNSSAGIVKVNNGVYGIKVIEGGIIGIIRATDDDIESLTDKYKVIVPANLKKAVETIGGAIDSLDTENKTSYVSALNEVLRYATRTKSWRKIRTITVPGIEADQQTINGVFYSARGGEVSGDLYGITTVTFSTDEDGNMLEGRNVTDVYIKFTPTEETNINQGFIKYNDLPVNYFIGLRTTGMRFFNIPVHGMVVNAESGSTARYRANILNVNEIKKVSFYGHERGSILGEGSTLDFYAYGYWDDLENEEV